MPRRKGTSFRQNTVRLDEHRHAALMALALFTGRPMAELIREAVDLALEANR
jgi:predicted DNA-binding protein